MDEQTRLQALEDEIDQLLRHQPERLAWLLYRLDVDEERLRTTLAQSKEPEASVVLSFLLARCQQIIAHRKASGAQTHSTDQWSFDV